MDKNNLSKKQTDARENKIQKKYVEEKGDEEGQRGRCGGSEDDPHCDSL